MAEIITHSRFRSYAVSDEINQSSLEWHKRENRRLADMYREEREYYRKLEALTEQYHDMAVTERREHNATKSALTDVREQLRLARMVKVKRRWWRF